MTETLPLSPATRIAVIGLGYVGLPLAVALARHFDTLGFDISAKRIGELKQGHDRTDEIAPEKLRASTLGLSDNPETLEGAQIFIVTVPTPVDDNNLPDLKPVLSACRTVGPRLKKGAGQIVVFESTVYPGVTEDICGPELEKHSGLTCGVDFFLGYSPERINPGDREHTVDRITKVVSGQTPDVAKKLCDLYGAVTTGGTFLAANIKTAEAAKVIENAQRDINIAFVNEISQIFQKIGISSYDVLEAAGTKWNFLKFSPGLVGGHCIGVDPFYLAHRAMELGHNPEVILSGRRTNDRMGDFIAERISDLLPGKGRVLVLGLTFKEDVPDLRNSKVIDVIRGLEKRGFSVDIHDPLADPEEAAHEYGVKLQPRLAELDGDGRRKYACVVGAVPHRAYRDLTPAQLGKLLAADGLIADIKGMWRGQALPDGLRRWTL